MASDDPDAPSPHVSVHNSPPTSDDDDDDLPGGATVAETRAAVDLAKFLKGQPGRELRGNRLQAFYVAMPEHKDTLRQAKVPGRESGVRSLCALFPDRLAVRKVAHENGKSFDVVIMRAADAKAHASAAVRLATAVAGAYDKSDSGQSALQTIDDMLRDLKLELGSMAKLKQEVDARGICLRDGTEHGKGLRGALRGSKALTVNKELAKEYQYARKCLVVL